MSSSRLKSSVKGSAGGIGIEFTSSSFTALCLERESGFLSISGVASSLLSHDDDDSLAHSLKRLARGEKRKGIGQNVCISLHPQDATELIHAIPENMPKEALDAFVQTHIAQIVNNTEVEFLHGYQFMPSCVNGHKNAIIGMARAGIVEEACDALPPQPFNSHKVSSHNMAMVSAFFALHTKIAESVAPQVLLWLGEESTAMSIVCNGGLQFSTWLAFGARNLSVSLNKNARNGRQILKEEFANAISRWHEMLASSPNGTGTAETQAPPADNIWYSGQSDDMEPFAEMLSSILPDARVGAFGIPGNMLPTPDDTIHTDLTVAFGLALQSIEESPVTMFLLPKRLEWLEHKEREYPYLAVSSVLLIMGILALLMGMLVHLNRSISLLAREDDELNTCAKLIPQMQKYHERMSFYQKKMLPVAESLHRTHRFLEALQLWQEAEMTGDEEERSWGIYLADEISFERSNTDREVSEAPRTQTPARQPGSAMDLFSAEPARPVEPPQPSPRIHYVNVDDIRILKSMYIGGVVPLGKSRYKTVKDMQTQLVESGVYVNVDDHSDSMSRKFTDTYYTPWLSFLQENSKALQSEYTTFLMQLPFREEFIKEDLLQGSSTNRK